MGSTVYVMFLVLAIAVQYLVTSDAILLSVLNFGWMWPLPHPLPSRETNPDDRATLSSSERSLGSGEMQADQVRRATEKLHPDSRELQCGHELGPSSIAETRGVEIFVRAAYQGFHDGEHVWKYQVDFKNKGTNTVQMLTRHWIFVDAEGKVEEVKGPGARGSTPVLEPGGRWAYESGCTVPLNEYCSGASKVDVLPRNCVRSIIFCSGLKCVL